MATQLGLYETLKTVESFSKAGKFYSIKRNTETGSVSCNCPAWIFQKGGERKPCKHIRSLDVTLNTVVLENGEKIGFETLEKAERFVKDLSESQEVSK